MKINIEQSDTCTEVEITIKCSTIDENLEKLISRQYVSSFKKKLGF